jgi:hypothetical protein
MPESVAYRYRHLSVSLQKIMRSVLALCYACVMTKDLYVEALVALCRREGGEAVVANNIGSSAATIRQITSGVKLPSGKSRGVGPALVIRLSERYPDWLEAVTVLSSAHETNKDESDIVIPQFDTGGAMGSGLVLQEQPGIIKEWRVSDDWVRHNVHRITSPKNLAIVTGFGPSMQPVFNPGDPLLVDRGITRADVDGIYFFRVGTEGFVKQLQRIPTPNGLVLRAKSYNPLYDPFDIVEGMDFEVFARVVKVWKGEEF